MQALCCAVYSGSFEQLVRTAASRQRVSARMSQAPGRLRCNIRTCRCCRGNGRENQCGANLTSAHFVRGFQIVPLGFAVDQRSPGRVTWRNFEQPVHFQSENSFDRVIHSICAAGDSGDFGNAGDVGLGRACRKRCPSRAGPRSHWSENPRSHFPSNSMLLARDFGL
jgi:hypothetical protein